MSVSEQRMRQINRENYTDCVEWLKDKEGLNLETKTAKKVPLTLEGKEAYIKEAEEALQTIITKKWKDNTANVIPKVGTFCQACRNGGINVKEQREMFWEQARLYFELSPEDQQLAEREVKEYEQDNEAVNNEVGSSTENNSSNTNNVGSSTENNSSSTNMSSSNNINDDKVVVGIDEEEDDDDDDDEESDDQKSTTMNGSLMPS